MDNANGNPTQQQGPMHEASGHEESGITNARRSISPDIYERIKHLDVKERERLRFNENEVAGVGTYGDIFRGELDVEGQDRKKVCVKRLRLYVANDITLLFEREIYVWSKLKHPNVLPLLGFSFACTGFPMLISEWMDNGTAWTYVLKHPDNDLLRLISGIANGLAYLHDQGVIHSDLKSNNVLVTKSGEAVICDFGVSRMLAASKSLANVSSELYGTARYWAPELLTTHSARHCKATDVWAFGMTTYELLTMQLPYGDAMVPQIIGAISRNELPELPNDLTSGVPATIKEALWNTCRNCWEIDPARRPAMEQIITAIAEAVHPGQRDVSKEIHPGVFEAITYLHDALDYSEYRAHDEDSSSEELGEEVERSDGEDEADDRKYDDEKAKEDCEYNQQNADMPQQYRNGDGYYDNRGDVSLDDYDIGDAVDVNSDDYYVDDIGDVNSDDDVGDIASDDYVDDIRYYDSD